MSGEVTPADLRESYFDHYGFGEWTTLTVLAAGRSTAGQVQRAAEALAKQDRRVELHYPAVHSASPWIRINRSRH
jgi:hypothetical protein